MRELSLFTGAGGGVLGSLLLGWETIGYVEWDKYCQQVIAARIADGHLPVAPIFGDVREFILSGAADQYRGFADVVSGGFPCQPFSVAGKRAGADDHRNMWPATIECIRRVQPRYAFLENVPGLLASGYFGTILGDLAESGYDARWRILSAAELGAPHKRDRLWIVAADAERQRPTAGAVRGRDVRDENGNGAGSLWGNEQQSRATWLCENVPNRIGVGLEGEQQAGTEAWAADRSGDGRNSGWWEAEPDVGRVADGVAARVDRLKAIGNGQVPAVAAAAWRLLTQDF